MSDEKHYIDIHVVVPFKDDEGNISEGRSRIRVEVTSFHPFDIFEKTLEASTAMLRHLVIKLTNQAIHRPERFTERSFDIRADVSIGDETPCA